MEECRATKALYTRGLITRKRYMSSDSNENNVNRVKKPFVIQYPFHFNYKEISLFDASRNSIKIGKNRINIFSAINSNPPFDSIFLLAR